MLAWQSNVESNHFVLALSVIGAHIMDREDSFARGPGESAVFGFGGSLVGSGGAWSGVFW